MPDADEIREKADEILLQPEYRPEPEGVVSRVFGWINDQFAELLGSVFGGAGSSIIGWLVLIAALGAILYMLWRVMPRRMLARAAPEVTIEQSQQTRAGRDEWLAQAEAAERAGNWSEAVRARYRATVAALIDRQEVDDAPGATSGEYRRSFDAPAARTDPFGAATDRFETVWYGEAAAAADDAELMRALDEPVLSTSEQSTAGKGGS